MRTLVFLILSLLVSCSHKGHYKKYDLNGDGQITKKEFLDAHDQKFDRMDKNNDGVWTQDEVKFHKHGKCKKCGMKKKDCQKCQKSCEGEQCKIKNE